MKKIKNLILMLIILGIGYFTNVSASVIDADAVHSLLSNDGATINVKSIDPDNMVNEEYCTSLGYQTLGACRSGLYFQTVRAYINDIIKDLPYISNMIDCSSKTSCTVSIIQCGPIFDPEYKEVTHTYTINYIGEDNQTKINEAKEYISKLKNEYRLMDLLYINQLVNYDITEESSILNNVYALKMYPELKKIVETYPEVNFMVGFNGAGAGPLSSGNSGGLFVGIDGIFYGTIETTFLTDHIIVIPNSIEDTNDSNIEAAENRILNYVNRDDVTVNIDYVEDRNWDAERSDGTTVNLLDEAMMYYFNTTEGITDRGTYYMTLDVGEAMGVSYESEIIIVSVPQVLYDKLNATIESVDAVNGIKISTKGNNVPLDTSLETEDYSNNEQVKNALKESGDALIAAYDINLYSVINDKYITEIEDGVEVLIPIDSDYNKDTIEIVHITDEGNTGEKYIADVVVIDEVKYAKFTTNHFSTYAVINSTGTKNPKTNDEIMIFAFFGFISLLAIILYNKVFSK